MRRPVSRTRECDAPRLRLPPARRAVRGRTSAAGPRGAGPPVRSQDAPWSLAEARPRASQAENSRWTKPRQHEGRASWDPVGTSMARPRGPSCDAGIWATRPRRETAGKRQEMPLRTQGGRRPGSPPDAPGRSPRRCASCRGSVASPGSVRPPRLVSRRAGHPLRVTPLPHVAAAVRRGQSAASPPPSRPRGGDSHGKGVLRRGARKGT